MTVQDIINRISSELSQLCAKPLTEQTAIAAKNKVEAILAMALVQKEIDGFSDIQSSLLRHNYIYVEAKINNSTTSWELSKKISVPKDAVSAYDRAMKGI